MWFSNIAMAVSEMLWAPRCSACDLRLPPVGQRTHPSGAALCDLCAETLLPIRSPKCPVCSLPSSSGPDHKCGVCIGDTPPFSTTHTAYLYGGALSTAVARFKYQPAPWLQKQLGSLLMMDYPERPAPDLIIPVPLHPHKLRRRGFNQSALLAASAARVLGRPLVTSVLHRVRHTEPQAGLGRKERLAALEGAFSVSRSRLLSDANVLLVDDVVTTTATIRSASEILIRSGAARVDILALARTA